ncbi:MAG: ferrous iron transport protein A, partial [Bacteroidetes bacterium]|nr:ferrous iron transport protein A [Bacteroidota bacterium]
DAKGKLNIPKSYLLSKFKKNDVCIMTGVVDHSTTFLQYLDRSGISLGSEIKIKEIIEFDRSLQIAINKGVSVFISNDVAKNILVIIK